MDKSREYNLICALLEEFKSALPTIEGIEVKMSADYQD